MAENNKKFKKIVIGADFIRAKGIANKLSIDDQKKILINISFKERSINGYGYLWFLLQNKDSAEYHWLASIVLQKGLCDIPYSYPLAIFHASEAVKLAPRNKKYVDNLKKFKTLQISKKTEEFYNLQSKKMDKDDRKMKFKKAVLEADFVLAKELISDFSIEEIDKILFNLSYDIGSVNPYAFICYLIKSNEKAVYHSIAAVILALGISHIHYVYHLALYHARKAAEIDKTRKEFLLFFYDIPDKPLSDKEALQTAKDILKTDPKNKRALEAIERLEKKSKP